MELDLLVTLVEQYGYAALFFSLWLGIVGMPIPDEVIVMSGGMLTATRWLQPIPAFLITYLGVVSGLTLGYVLGYKLGAPLWKRVAKGKRGETYLARAELLLDRYGSWALSLSYFFPVVRHLVPYLVGINRMPVKRYALYSLPAGLVWTLVYFSIGRLFGQSIEAIGHAVHTYGLIALSAVGILALLYLGVRSLRGNAIDLGGSEYGRHHDSRGG